MRYRISVERNRLRFSAAHFATYGGDCEPLHGHNYAVLVEVEGDLTGDCWVIDFTELKQIVAGLCQELDQRFLLATGNPHLAISETDVAYEIRFADRRYVMPKRDVAPLPIDNSTAERLAEYLCARLAKELRARGINNISAITVAVEEAPGQAGWYSAPFLAS